MDNVIATEQDVKMTVPTKMDVIRNQDHLCDLVGVQLVSANIKGQRFDEECHLTIHQMILGEAGQTSLQGNWGTITSFCLTIALPSTS